MTPDELTYDERGLIPAVVQEAETGEVLMVAWMDRDAVAKTLTTGITHFWSRSRRAPWQKGETSGHVQHVQGVYADCDVDTLVVQVHQDRKAGAGHDVPDRSAPFSEVDQVDVRLTVPRADQGESADLVGGESGFLDQPCAQRIVRRRKHQRAVAQDQLTP